MRNLEESLFWEIFYRRQVVRSELAQLFNVSAATISRSAGVLLSRRMIVETGVTSSSRGRRPTLLQINPALAHVAGVEIDRDRITAVVTDMAGNLLGRGATGASSRHPVRRTLERLPDGGTDRRCRRYAFASLGPLIKRVRQAFENSTKTVLRAQVKSPSQLTLDTDRLSSPPGRCSHGNSPN